MTDVALFDKRYRLHRGIARVTNGGGVYAAEHIFTHKPCAIKVFDANVREIVRKRAFREMETLARAQGPGIVEFRDAGEVAGRVYIVTELLEGRTLGGLLAAKGHLAIADAVAVCARIANVLARLHAIGIVHRDVKPLNVHVSHAGAVHVLDLGIAKLVDPTANLEKLTQENALLGTPEYMAPEALLASPDVDQAVDQYALGVTMYECLTGVVPFEGSYSDVVKKMSTPMKPVRALRPDVPEELEAFVARALRHEPKERFGSMSEMHAALVAIGARAAELELPAEREGQARVAATIADSPSAKRPQTRRRHPRAPYASLARIEREDRSGIDGRVQEISESGCQFVAEQSTNAGETVTARFSLPISGRVINIVSICRWTRATRVAMAAGFEFTSVSADALEEIRKYVLLMGGD